MSSFILFVSLALAFAVTMAVIVLSPWLKTPKSTEDNQLLSLNIDVFKQRLAELEKDFADNLIDKATYDSQKLALERQLLDISEEQDTKSFKPNWKSNLIFLVWIPFLTAMAYLIVSDRTSVFQLWQAQDSVGKVADDLLTGKIDSPPAWASKDSQALIMAMQTNVHQNATDPMRWYRLSEIFLALQAPEQAIEALARANRLSPDDEKIAITYAQTSFFAQGGIMDSKVRQVVEHLLAKNPKHQGGQMLMAMGEMRDGNYQQARHWLNVLKTDIQSRSGDHSQALQSLAELEKTIDDKEQQSKATVQISVNITPETLGRVKKGDTLFVSIRPLTGGMPVAVKKLSADTLTKDGMMIDISDNDSLMPTLKLSQAINKGDDLVAIARISTSGDATPQSGDLTSNPAPLAEKGNQTQVMIDKVNP